MTNKKKYTKPNTTLVGNPALMAAPLAFFSVATAAAAVVGAAAGAVATSKMMSVTTDSQRCHALPEIKGLLGA